MILLETPRRKWEWKRNYFYKLLGLKYGGEVIEHEVLRIWEEGRHKGKKEIKEKEKGKMEFKTLITITPPIY